MSAATHQYLYSLYDMNLCLPADWTWPAAFSSSVFYGPPQGWSPQYSKGDSQFIGLSKRSPGSTHTHILRMIVNADIPTTDAATAVHSCPTSGSTVRSKLHCSWIWPTQFGCWWSASCLSTSCPSDRPSSSTQQAAELIWLWRLLKGQSPILSLSM